MRPAIRLWLVVCVLVLAGCGVRPSGVIPGIDAPVGRANGVVLFLLRDGRLTAVTRPSQAPVFPDGAIELLAAGPNGFESRQGFTSEVPAGVAVADISVSHADVTISLSTNVTGLSTVAVQQIVCTVAGNRSMVVLVGPDDSRRAAACPL